MTTPAHKQSNRADIDRDRLVLENRGLVFHFARRFADCGMDRAEVTAIADLALVEAADRFDPALGYFGAYASRYIFGRLMNAVTRDWDRGGIGGSDIDTVSLQDVIAHDDDGSALAYEDTIADPSPSPEDICIARDLERKRAAIIARELPLIPERERFVLEHGIMSDDPMSHVAMAKQLEVSRQYVDQIERRAVARLRRALRVLDE